MPDTAHVEIKTDITGRGTIFVNGVDLSSYVRNIELISGVDHGPTQVRLDILAEVVVEVNSLLGIDVLDNPD